MQQGKLSSILGYIKGFWGYLILSLVLMIVELLLTFVSPLVMSVTIDSVLGDKPLDVAWYFEWFVKAVGGVEVIRHNLWIMAVAMVVLKALSGALTFTRAYANNKAGEGAVNKLRNRFYSHVQELPFRYHVSAQTGDLIQRATNDIDTVRRFVAGNLLEFVRTILLFVVGVFIMVEIHVPLTVVSLSLAPVIVLTSFLFFSKIQSYFDVVEQADGRMFTIIQENLTGTRVVRAFGRQRFELDKFHEGNEDLRKKSITLNNLFANLWGSLDLISGVQIALVAIFGIYFAVSGSLTLGEFTAFTSYVYIFLWPIRGFGRILSDFGRTLVAVGRLEEVLNERAEDQVENGQKPALSGDIEFRNVNFAYDDNKVLKNLNMHIKGGQTIAILGGTGSGKSTLVQLLQRLYDIQGGEIKISGVDI
ncbi:MAG: ATP-binding cassette domain-containing protein, partial [Oscillospiraceae bacterium]|nr:ATP-binding cassette domain-containing protein [Oscillospiraceae bacterium]